jgi:sulfur relay (sulfurtransferase) DsrF/TusC family protein
MAEHLLIETRGTWDGPGCDRLANDALALARGGHKVNLVLLEDGVTAALPGAVPALDELASSGGAVWVDELSLRQRGLAAAELGSDMRHVDAHAVAEKLMDPDVRVLWH